ncbi:hypothetical protein Tco_0744308 [Tanacetum coccineum]
MRSDDDVKPTNVLTGIEPCPSTFGYALSCLANSDDIHIDSLVGVPASINALPWSISERPPFKNSHNSWNKFSGNHCWGTL